MSGEVPTKQRMMKKEIIEVHEMKWIYWSFEWLCLVVLCVLGCILACRCIDSCVRRKVSNSSAVGQWSSGQVVKWSNKRWNDKENSIKRWENYINLVVSRSVWNKALKKNGRGEQKNKTMLKVFDVIIKLNYTTLLVSMHCNLLGGVNLTSGFTPLGFEFRDRRQGQIW